MFPDSGWKRLTEKMIAVASLTHVEVVVDHTIQCQPHCKDQQSYRSRTHILISVFTPSRLHLLSKTSWASVFLHIFYSRPFNEMSIVSGESHCCNIFTDVRFTSLLAKKFKKNTNYFYAARISILLSIMSEIFIQIGYFF